MQADPVRSLRYQFSREVLSNFRAARKAAIDRIRRQLQWKGVDVEELSKILDEINTHYITEPGQASIYRFTNLSYQRGVSLSLEEMMRAPKPKGFRLEVAASFTLKDQQAIKNLAALSFAALQGISAEMAPKMVRNIVEADKKGLGVTRISKILYDDYNSLGMPRAERIVRTSINQAYNASTFSRISDYAPYKEWLPHLGDDRTRPGHRKMAGVIVPTEDPFEVPGWKPSPRAKRVPDAKMMHPGDTSLGADLAQVLNCRCTVVGRFLKK